MFKAPVCLILMYIKAFSRNNAEGCHRNQLGFWKSPASAFGAVEANLQWFVVNVRKAIMLPANLVAKLAWYCINLLADLRCLQT